MKQPIKRDCSLPSGCKDLFDALQLKQKLQNAQQRRDAKVPIYPPITQRILLPEKVSVRYLAEISGQNLWIFTKTMQKLRIVVSANRSVDFSDAQRILRLHGIWADREPSTI